MKDEAGREMRSRPVGIAVEGGDLGTHTSIVPVCKRNAAVPAGGLAFLKSSIWAYCVSLTRRRIRRRYKTGFGGTRPQIDRRWMDTRAA